jgi:hypothetical protein
MTDTREILTAMRDALDMALTLMDYELAQAGDPDAVKPETHQIPYDSGPGGPMTGPMTAPAPTQPIVNAAPQKPVPPQGTPQASGPGGPMTGPMTGPMAGPATAAAQPTNVVEMRPNNDGISVSELQTFLAGAVSRIDNGPTAIFNILKQHTPDGRVTSLTADGCAAVKQEVEARLNG